LLTLLFLWTRSSTTLIYYQLLMLGGMLRLNVSFPMAFFSRVHTMKVPLWLATPLWPVFGRGWSTIIATAMQRSD
jgi:hypothetical protein